jgi:hypothetical protein
VSILQLDIPQGLVGDNTDFANQGWKDGSNFRFYLGYAEMDGGFEKFTLNTLPGVCRTIFGWTDQNSIINYAFGLHNGLFVDQNGDFADITPAASSFASGTITVSANPVANQTFTVGSQLFTFKASRAVAGDVAIGANTTATATNIVSALNLDLGALITASSAASVVTVVADTGGFAGNLPFKNGNATGIVFSGYGFLQGGGTFAPGQISGTGSAGFGTGAFGGGNFGQSVGTDFFPLTWSGGARRGLFYFSPRGQTAFEWNGNVASDAVPLANAPEKINSLLTTTNGQLMALGCTDTGGLYNPVCIRITDPRFPTAWFPALDNTAQQTYLNATGRLVGGRNIGNYVVVWTDSEAHFGTFSSPAWNFERAGPGGLCGPNAAVTVGQTAFWLTPDLQFMTYAAGGEPTVLLCPVRDEFVANAAPSQNDKIVASTYRSKEEIRWDYADRRDGDGIEVSRFVRFNFKTGAWSKGSYARTAFIDAGPGKSPLGTTYDGTIYAHETTLNGSLADGGQYQAFIESGDLYLGSADRQYLLRKMWPDLKDQFGPCWLTVWTRRYPQDSEVEFGPYSMAPGKSEQDLLCQGRVMRFRLSWDSAPAGGRLGRLSVDVQPTSQR